MKSSSGITNAFRIGAAMLFTGVLITVASSRAFAGDGTTASMFRIQTPAEPLTGFHLWRRDSAQRRWIDFEAKGEPMTWSSDEEYFPRMHGIRAVDLLSDSRAFKAIIIDNDEVQYKAPQQRSDPFLLPEILVFVMYPSSQYDSILSFCQAPDANAPKKVSVAPRAFSLPAVAAAWVPHGETVEHRVNDRLASVLDPSAPDNRTRQGLSLSLQPVNTADGPAVRFLLSRYETVDPGIEGNVLNHVYFEVPLRKFIAFIGFLNHDVDRSRILFGRQ